MQKCTNVCAKFVMFQEQTELRQKLGQKNIVLNYCIYKWLNSYFSTTKVFFIKIFIQKPVHQYMHIYNSKISYKNKSFWARKIYTYSPVWRFRHLTQTPATCTYFMQGLLKDSSWEVLVLCNYMYCLVLSCHVLNK